MICVRFASDLRQKRRYCEKYNKLFIAGFIFVISILLIGLVIAEQNQSQEELEAELTNLTSYLTAQGYSWLINYSINESASIEVYKENGDELITTINDINDEGWYKVYLSDLSNNESYDVFDLNQGGENVH